MRFDDGSQCTGSLLVACDGASSRVRRALFPAQPTYQIPIRVLGLRVDCTPDQIGPLRTLDPFFLQGTSSLNNTYVYFSSESFIFYFLYLLVLCINLPVSCSNSITHSFHICK